MPTTAYLLSLAAHHAPSADNSQPWRLSWKENTISVSYDKLRVGDRTFPADSHASLLSIGALSENFTQASRALGINTELSWVLDFNSATPLYFEATISQDDTVNPTDFGGLALFKRHTNRLPYQKRPLPADCVEALKKLTENDIRILVFEDKTTIRQIAKLVKKASEIRFQTKEIHEWLSKSFRFDTKVSDPYGDGLDVKTIDLPPGGSLFLRLIGNWTRMNWLNKLGAHKAMAIIDSQPVYRSPALIAIVGPENLANQLAAGQLMNRAWIALNEQGLAVHPYYVVADQLQRFKNGQTPRQSVSQADTLVKQTHELLGLNEGETLHMLLRTGYPNKKPIYSKRLALKEVCDGIVLE